MLPHGQHPADRRRIGERHDIAGRRYLPVLHRIGEIHVGLHAVIVGEVSGRSIACSIIGVVLRCHVAVPPIGVRLVFGC